MPHIENNRLTKYIGTNDFTVAITDYQSKQNRKKKQTNKQTCVLRVYFTNFKKNIETSIALTSIIQILFSNLIFF